MSRAAQITLEVGERLPFPCVELSGDHMNQDVLAPAVLQRCPEIPLPRRPVLDSVQNAYIVPPGQLCNKLLHNWFLRPGLCQGTHVFEASGAEALDARKLVLQIMGKPVYDPGKEILEFASM